jgi:EAL domain-containing protein (putative c-di-GMP-specific phosphodiesterase class I)
MEGTMDIIQRHENKAPWYARNSDIHRDLGVEKVASIIARHAISHENRLQHHVTEEASASRLLNVQHLIRRLKRTKPLESVNQFHN